MMTATMNENMTTGKDKPIILRSVFILNMIKIALTIGTFVAVEFFNVSLGGVQSSAFLYMLAGYVVTFALMVTSILKRNVMGFRAVMVVDIIISLPLKAFIAVAIGLYGLGTSFLSKAMKAYFAYRDQ